MQPTGRLTAQVSWLGLKVSGHLALSYISQMNRVYSRSDFVTMTEPYTSTAYFTTIVSHVLQILQETKKTVL